MALRAVTRCTPYYSILALFHVVLQHISAFTLCSAARRHLLTHNSFHLSHSFCRCTTTYFNTHSRQMRSRHMVVMGWRPSYFQYPLNLPRQPAPELRHEPSSTPATPTPERLRRYPTTDHNNPTEGPPPHSVQHPAAAIGRRAIVITAGDLRPTDTPRRGPSSRSPVAPANTQQPSNQPRHQGWLRRALPGRVEPSVSKAGPGRPSLTSPSQRLIREGGANAGSQCNTPILGCEILPLGTDSGTRSDCGRALFHDPNSAGNPATDTPCDTATRFPRPPSDDHEKACRP